MAGSTPIYGFPYPQPSDLVANYPALGQQLAEDVETELQIASTLLQVVNNIDSTNRATSSTSAVDVTGMTVTITPKLSSTNIILIATGFLRQEWNSAAASESRTQVQITDSSNNVISGAGLINVGLNIAGFAVGASQTNDHQLAIIGIVSSATTASRTYKLRFNVINANTSTTFLNATCAGRMYALEVKP
jgi:hypothetical protein